MTCFVATSPGLYPLPDWAKDELSERKGHQKHDLIDGSEGPEIAAVYDDVRSDLVASQTEAGLDRIVEGQGRWDDMLAHPLAVNDAVETRGIVRYYDNNNFYREPVVTGDLEPTGDIAADLEAVDVDPDRRQAVLPGPNSLAALATDEHYGDEADFLAAVASLLAGELERCPTHGTCFLLEPSLVTDPPENGERAREAIDTVAAATDADVVTFSYWDSFEESLHAHLLDADVEALGYDLVSDHESTRYLIQEYGSADDIALGLVDGQNTLVESPETIRDRVHWLLEDLPVTDFGTVYLSTNTEPFYLPSSKFEEKLAVLGEAAETVEVTPA